MTLPNPKSSHNIQRSIKVQQTIDDLNRQLSEQLDFLQTSANRYDQGHTIEAKRMAVTLRILLHDTKNCKSLLGQLNKKGIQFHDTTIEDMSNVTTSYCGLVMVSIGSGRTKYIAMLDDVPCKKMVDFDTWWNAIIFRDLEGHQISRKNLVVTMANQDGGAHVDPSINEEYSRLSKGKSLGRMYSVDGKKWFDMLSADLSSVRQIAHEVLKSLIPNYTKNPQLPKKGILMGGFRLIYEKKPVKDFEVTKNSTKKPGRNDPCPCGSGEKYKKCCGRKIF